MFSVNIGQHTSNYLCHDIKCCHYFQMSVFFYLLEMRLRKLTMSQENYQTWPMKMMSAKGKLLLLTDTLFDHSAYVMFVIDFVIFLIEH